MMADMENAIKWIEWFLQNKPYVSDPDTYAGFVSGLKDALSLLKEQEPKQVETEVVNEIDRLYRCPSCHISMIFRKQPYCHWCGQGVKWE